MSAPESLLDPAFIRRLEALRHRLKHRAASGVGGEQLAKQVGSSAEFQEHRAYVPGDDVRRIDWSAYARSGEPVLKLFRAERDTMLRLLIDGSASVGHGNPPKIAQMRQLAAAISYMALRNGQRVQLAVSGGQANSLPRMSAPARGQPALGRLFKELSHVEIGGTGDLARSIEQVVRVNRRPGLLLVLSDFLDDGPVISSLNLARARGHEVALVQVLAPAEVEPDLAGELVLVDCETEQTLEISVDAATIRAYLQRLEQLIEALRGWAVRSGSRFVQTVSDQRLEDLVRLFLEPS